MNNDSERDEGAEREKADDVVSKSTRKLWKTPYVIVAELASDTAKFNAGPEHNRSGQISYGPQS